MNTNVFRNLSYGVYAITCWDNGRPTGCIANSAMQITSSPATIAISINKNNYTHSCIENSESFGISILKETTDPSVIGTLGFSSGKDVNKFEGVSYEVKDYFPILTDCCGYITCKVTNKMDCGTHTVFLGEVTGGDISDGDPMTYSYYHKVIKGKSPKNAPTYIPDEEITDSYVCSVCGYIYDGEVPFDELPEDYRCPICNQPKKVFQKK
ncbi:MAG: flavin reductase [Clostridiales bacterium]|mgnify:CR=1 FL=1|nr:flavin reductase [Clostridiales bacterium]